uniref:Ycf1 n=1 Tax=Pseudochlorodesmis sp. HV01306a TaxID=2358488 RepID=A0A386AY44_9CHLO|nr:hypothetical protein Ycf1 [Pseudochlorodesmis sp. HV01306a]
MALIPLTETLKNTIEILNEIYEIQSPGFQWLIFFKFAWNVVLDWIIYTITFQWLNDFITFSINIPHETESIFSDLFNPFWDNPYPNKLSLLASNFAAPLDELNTSSLTFLQTSLISGFLNCFFLYFPLSPIQFIWLRRVVIDGQWAGRAATVGIILGHLSLIGCCLFGLRTIINTWFGIEPISYFIGIWLIFIVIFEMTHSPFKIIKQAQKKELLKIFLINFGLVWTDQSGFYQIFGNLSLQSGSSLLDFAFYHSQFSIYLYFFGIICGSFCWTFLISNLVLQIGYLFSRFTKYPYSYWIRGLNHFCLIGCITLTITSFPYYGTDYLFANPLGFIPQDSFFESLPIPLLNPTTKDATKGRLGEKSSFASVDTDLSIFDRGRYAGGPMVEVPIESLNYQEEYAWRSRFDRLSSRSLNKGGGLFHQYLTAQLGPIEEDLKKQRREKKRIQQLKKLKKLLNKMEPTEFQTYNLPPELTEKLMLNKKTNFKNDLEAPLEATKQHRTKRSKKRSNKKEDANLTKSLPTSSAEFLEYYEQLIERFVEDYTAEANTEDPDVPDLVEEKMIHFSAFSEIAKYGFDLFSMFEELDPSVVDEELSKEIKEKFTENLVYRSLLNLDISSFLKRELPVYKLTSKDEIALFEKRLALGEYYDTLRSYSEMPLNTIFQPLFCGPKSYSNRIYNQQFKGTFKIVERLFSIHLEDEKNIPDLPNPDSGVIPIPSRIEKENLTPEEEEEKLYLKLQQEPSVLKFDQPLYKENFLKKNPLIHEQLLEQQPQAFQEADSNPFLQEAQPFPFFVGWDSEQRKFNITNRLLTRQKTLTNLLVEKKKLRKSFSADFKAEFKKDKIPQSARNESKTPQFFTFTTWPVSANRLQKNPILSRLFLTREEMLQTSAGEDLFKYAEPLMEEDAIIYKTLPNIVKRVELKNPEKLQASLAPSRGGFIWPGNEQLKYSIEFPHQVQEILKNWNLGNLIRK